MGKCKFCGQSAGLFSHVHKACEQRHARGIEALEYAVRTYLRSAATADIVRRAATDAARNAFASETDIATAAAKCLDEWTNTIHWPFHKAQLDKVSALLAALGVTRRAVNRDGALDRLAQKMLRGFMAEYFTGQRTLSKALQIADVVTQTLPLTEGQRREAYYQMLGQAGTNFLRDGALSPQEEQRMDEYVATLGLSLTDLPRSLRGTDVERIGQRMILADLQAGRPPRSTVTAAVLLRKDETALWCYNGVCMYQEKVEREYVGRTGGISVRVMKGVTYRTGTFRSRPIETSYMQLTDTGSLYITNRHIIFMGRQRSIRVPYTKIIGITPYADGMEVQRDGVNVKRLIFQGFNSAFVMDVLSVIG